MFRLVSTGLVHAFVVCENIFYILVSVVTFHIISMYQDISYETRNPSQIVIAVLSKAD